MPRCSLLHIFQCALPSTLTAGSLSTLRCKKSHALGNFFLPGISLDAAHIYGVFGVR